MPNNANSSERAKSARGTTRRWGAAFPDKVADPAPSPLSAYVTKLAQLRDAVLVLVSLVYLLGFLSWAVHAARYDLGLVRALDAQYLVAGILPAIVVALGIALAVLHVRFSRWSGAEPSEYRFKWANRVTTAGMLLAVGGTLALWLPDTLVHEEVARAVLFVGAYVVMAGSLLQGSKGPALFRWYSLGVLWVIVAFVPVILLVLYLEHVFPSLPAALGGPAPRCVVVDVAVQELSADTRNALLPVSSDTGNVRQTRAVNVLFDGPEFIMLSVKDEGTAGPVYAIAKKAVLALTACRQTAQESAAPK